MECKIHPKLTLAIRIFAKCEFVSGNVKHRLEVFTKFGKQYLVKGIRNYFKICERKFENAKENYHAFATFAKGILRPSASQDTVRNV